MLREPSVQRSAQPPATAHAGHDEPIQVGVGKHTLIERTFGRPSAAREIAAGAVAHGGGKLPYFDEIQRSFGRHDLSDVSAHQGPAVHEAAHALGARAFAVGNTVAFGDAPDLHTAAHEAAHVIQQRGGVQLSGGIDRPGDMYEQHADAVADAVVAGQPAEHLLDRMAGSASGSRVVQRNPKPGTATARQEAPVPVRGEYLVERTADGSYVFVFNTSDRNGWSEPILTGLRYYMQQAFPGVSEAVIRTVLTDLKVKLDRHGPAALPDNHRYELQVDVQLHQRVVAWMAAHHPELTPHAPKLGGGALHQGEAAGAGSDAHGARADGGKPHGATMTAAAAGSGAARPADKVSTEVELARALYERLRRTFPDEAALGGRSAWPEFLAYVSDHA